MKKFTLAVASHLKWFFLLFGGLLFHQEIIAAGLDIPAPADIVVKGIVSSNEGPLSGVTVTVENSSTVAITDASGAYTITAPEKGTLIFSYSGYREQRIAIKGQPLINVTMVPGTNQMDEVVVVGYRAQKRGTVTGSVSSVNSAEFANVPVDNLSNALSGRLSGVTITQGAGTPGMESAIRIRTQGTFNNASPLFVIDGVVSDKFAFDGLSSNEVESITVLKDGASAAIYGSRAANGVVLVTTKRGREGVPRLNYNGIYGIQSPTKIPERLNAYEHAMTINNAYKYNNITSPATVYYSQDELDYFKTHSWNWVDAMWRNPNTTQHSLDVSGGSNNVKYFLGSSYNFSTGSFKTIDFRKLTLRGNIDVSVTKNLKLSLDINTDERKTNGPNWDVNNLRYDDLFKALMFRSAMVPPYVNGLPVGNSVEWHPGVVTTKDLSGYNTRNWTGYNMIATVNYAIPFVKGLSAKASINRYNRTIYTKNFSLPYQMAVFETTGTNNHIVGDKVKSYNTRATQEFLLSRSDMIKRYQFNAQINYKRNFGKHGIDALVVYEQAEDNTIWFNGRKNDFVSSAIDQFVAASGVATVEGIESESARISYVGLASYNYAQKYLLEASFRYDGSVIFAPGKRWGFFPSASAGWRISDEPFFKNVKFVNDLKLRASIGLLGNDAIDPFQWMQAYVLQVNNQQLYGAVFNDQTIGLQPGVVPNPNVTWEKSLSYNAGLDARFLNNKMNLKLDLFKRHSYDILGSRVLSLPSTLGAPLPDENYQEIDAKGFELELGYDGHVGSSQKQFTYYVRGNYGFATNKIVKVDQAQNIRPYMNALGRPVGLQANGNINRNGNAGSDQLFGLMATGVIRTQAEVDALGPNYTIMGVKPQIGMLNYKDIRGPNDDKPDGKITNDDRVFLAKYSIPPTNFGLSLGGSWRSISLDILIQGVAGAKNMLPTAGRDIQARPEESSFRYWADSWSPDNPNGKYPGYRVSPVTAFRTRFDPSSFFLVDNSFVRLKNLSLSYSLPQSVISRTGIKNARVFFAGTNLFLIYSGNHIYDPEVNNILSYPMMKGYSFGLNIGL